MFFKYVSKYYSNINNFLINFTNVPNFVQVPLYL